MPDHPLIHRAFEAHAAARPDAIAAQCAGESITYGALDREATRLAARLAAEGADDMPSHIRAALTSTSETIPIVDGALALGTWQGLYLFEHRRRAGARSVVVTITGE